MSSYTLCRLCVSESTELLDMCKLHYGETPAIKYVVEVLDIKMDRENTARVMCSDCNTALSNFHSFCRMVREAQHKLDYINKSPDIKPHTAFTTEYPFQCKIEYVEDEYPIENTENYTWNNFQDNDDCSSIGLFQKCAAQSTQESENQNINSQNKFEIDNSRNTTIAGSSTSLNTSKDKIVKTRKTSKKATPDSGPVPKRRNIPRSQKATKALFSKYKVEEIYKDGRWQVNPEQKDEIFRLYIDMKCSQCGAVFSTYPQLDEHSMSQHKTHPTVVCDSFSLASYELMERHVLYKHILNCKMPRLLTKIPCNICNKLVRGCNMREHLSSHLPHDKREFQCDYCHAGFGSKGVLKGHIAMNHEVPQVACDQCGKLFRNKYHVTQHKKRVHGSTDNAHLCPECGKRYRDLLTFSNHVNGHFGIVDRVKCSICEAVIKKSCLSAHMRAHDAKNQKQCPHCPYKGFRIREHVKRAHEKLRPHPCKFCPKKFYNEKGLKEHTSSCHIGIPEYTCEFCGASFMSSSNFHSHRKKMHPKHWALQKLEKANKFNSGDIPVCDPSSLSRNKHIIEGEKAELIIQDLQNRKKKLKKESETKTEKDS